MPRLTLDLKGLGFHQTEGRSKHEPCLFWKERVFRMSDNPEKTGLDGRGREKSGRIDHKHPTTKIKHLREHYGAHFADGWDGERTLGELLSETKFESLTQYVKHHGHQPTS